MIGILVNIALQLFYFILSIYLGGFIISLINRKFYGLFANSRAVIYATGFIGTPIHESSHALMCLLFAHKIEEVKFFQIDDESGVLGYVRHSYNPKNIYAKIGNYFIGIAPILMGCGLLCLSMSLLLPNAFRAMSPVGSGLKGSSSSFVLVGRGISAFFDSFFSSVGNWQFWIFLLLNLCIALHMNMSGADIKGTLTALPFLIGLIVIMNVILGFAWFDGYRAYVNFMNDIGVWIIALLSLSIGFALFYLVVGALIQYIAKVIKN